MGVGAIALGVVLIGFSPNRWDPVLWAIPFRRGHGIHVLDLVGASLIGVGVVLLWFAPERR